MSERLRIDYDALFRVDIRLTFFLNRGDVEFEHMSPEQQQTVLGTYDLRQHVDITPTPETLLLLRRHRLLLRPDALGFAVFASLSGRKMRFPFPRAERLRFHISAKNRHFSDLASLGAIQGDSPRIHVFSTEAANQDAEGLHLTTPLRGFSNTTDYPAGAQIVNNAAEPTQRQTAVQKVVRGSPRNADDWVETAELPPILAAPFVDTLTAGQRARKNGVIYEALIDAPGDDETDAAEWRRLFAPGIQAASEADAFELSGRFKVVSLGAAEPDFVAAQITDRSGRIVRREEFHGSAQQPLRTIPVDAGDQVGGTYRLTLRDRTGALLSQNGDALPQADQTLYIDGDAIRANAFAALEVASDSPGYELLDGNDEIRSPTYLLRIPSPVTFWSYTFPQPLTEDQQNQIGALFEMAEGPRNKIVTQQARGLGRGLVRLQRLNTGKLLPNPTEQTGIAIESDTGRLISPIYLSHKT